jgi:hypothetical protein
MQGWQRLLKELLARVALAAAAACAFGVAAPAAAQGACQLCVTKNFSPSSVPSGGTSTMSIRLVNTNKVDPFDLITFSDTFPAGMTLVSAGANQCSGTLTPTGTSGFTFANGSLNVGQACTITAVVSASGPAGPMVNSTSNFTYNDIDVTGTEQGVNGTLRITAGRPPTITSAPPPNGIQPKVCASSSRPGA